MELKSGYKLTEVGVIPEDWDVVAVSDLVEPSSPVCYGVVQVGRDTSDGVPIVSIKHVKAISTAPLHRTSPARERLYSRSRVAGGDVLISVKGTIGSVGIVPPAFAGNISRELARVRPRGHYNALYVGYQFEGGETQRRIATSVVGTTRLEFSISTLRTFCLPVPRRRDEQRAIAAALSDVDDLLDGLDRLIAKKRDLKRAAMQQLLTGQTRLPGFGAEWSLKPLSSVCMMRSGETITSQQIDDHSPFPCYGGNGPRGFTSRCTHDGVYALIGRQGALCGNVFGVNGRFFASEHAVVVSALPEADISWLRYVLVRLELNQYSESSAQPGLAVSRLTTLPVLCPPTKAEQTAIAEVLSDMDAEIAALEARRAKTRDLKQAMMQELLTGRTRLVAPAAVEA